MTKKVRIKIAALVTALFPGAVCTAGALTHTHAPTVSAASSAQTATPAQPKPGAIPSSSSEHDSYD
jgi:hypothetical protein